MFDGDGSGAPKAYLNYIYFDKNFIIEDVGYQQVSTAAKNSWELLDLDIDAKVPGYLYIYVANESTADVNVYFDNIDITLEESPMAGGNDFYPFGLPIAERSYDREDYRFDYQGQLARRMRRQAGTPFS